MTADPRGSRNSGFGPKSNPMHRMLFLALPLLAACQSVPPARNYDADLSALGRYHDARFGSEADQVIQQRLLALEKLEPALQDPDPEKSQAAVQEAKRLIHDVAKAGRPNQVACEHMLWKLASTPGRAERHEAYLLEFMARAQRSTIAIESADSANELIVDSYVLNPRKRQTWIRILIEKALTLFDREAEGDLVYMYCGLLTEILGRLDWATDARIPPLGDAPGLEKRAETILREYLRRLER
jgi:hypothetical protein